MGKKSIKDLVVRHYTKELEGNKDLTVFDLFEWKKVDVVLRDYKKGIILYEGYGLEFPVSYSQNACDIIASKYFRRAGVTSETGTETSMKEIINRLVSFWTESAYDEGILDNDTKQVFYDELCYIMLSQEMAPNSPQWFNTGLKLAYDIDKKSDGHYYYDTEKGEVVQSKDGYTRTQGSACFILDVNDSLLGDKSLTDQVVTETRLFKHGSGTGSNFSKVRAVGELLSGGGTSSGLMSFLKVFDRNAGAIKSGGTTRRAAKMVAVDDDHPEVLDFINWKSNEEEKVVALGKMGYDIDFNGEAYETVSGQNSNNSIMVSDKFLRKASGEDNNSTHELKGRVDSSVNKEVDAKEMFRMWNSAAWRSGDPAPQYSDTINAWHTCPAGEDGDINNPDNKIRSSNPCSEYFFLLDTACNLASVNAKKFYDPKTGKFDLVSYLHVVALTQIVLEATVHWGQFPTPDIARRSHLFRTTGLGLANTGALHMVMGHAYDSDEARAVASALMGVATGYSYYVSSLMAKEVGAFEKYDINKDHMLKVMRNHSRVVGARNDSYEGLNYDPLEIDHNVLKSTGLSELSGLVKKVWKDAYASGEEYGYRNAQTTVIAPTGTIAFAMDCEATSTEPFFSHVVYKKLAGGGFMEIVNPAIPAALEKLGYNEAEVKDIMDYVLRKEKVTENGYTYEKIVDGKIEGAPHLKPEHYPVFDTANTCGTGSRAISPMGHIRMLAALTPLVSGAISKTVNLPRTATVEDFESVHLDAWKLGVKAVSLYRDGCKASQPMNSAINNDEKKLEDFSYNELLELVKEQKHKLENPVRRRPVGIRPSRVHETKISGLKLYITVSFDSETGDIAEVYATADREGTIVKGLLDSLSKMISKQLQYGVPIKEIAKSLRGQKYEPAGLVAGHPYIKSVDSISDLISKILDIEMGDFSRVQIKPEENTFYTHKQIVGGPQTNLQAASTVETVPEKEEEEGEKVFGQTCSTCGSTKMKKNGTCYVCIECGSTTGCS